MRRIAIASVAVFAAVLAVVTSVESVAGRPLSDLLRGKSGQGTTVFGPVHQTSDTPSTVIQTVVPKVVVSTPTVTQTAPPVIKTTTPTVTPSTPAPSATTPPSTAPATTPPSTPPTSSDPPTA